MLWKISKLPFHVIIIVQNNSILKINFIHADQFCFIYGLLLSTLQYLNLMFTWQIGNNCLWVDPSCLLVSNIDHKSSNIVDIWTSIEHWSEAVTKPMPMTHYHTSDSQNFIFFMDCRIRSHVSEPNIFYLRYKPSMIPYFLNSTKVRVSGEQFNCRALC